MSVFNLNDFIEEVEIYGLRGRMINAPAQNKKARGLHILFVHGSHSSLERMKGVAEMMVEYGNFCLPDLPGFGGMDHFYSIGEKPTTDSYADYLAAFIKLHYGSRKKFVLVGYSMGFMVVTRMLQKYPELTKQIIDVVSVAGLVHKDNFSFTSRRKMLYTIGLECVKFRVPSWIMREVFLRKWFLGTIYTQSRNAKAKFIGLDARTRRAMVDFEITLWRVNHVPTWCYTTLEMFRCDLVTNAHHIPLNLIAVTFDLDQYFDNAVTEQHMKIIYNKVKLVKAKVDKHGVSVMETAQDVEAFFPKALRSHLKSLR
jgi:pimeloyl-ACP methyl ester carboxylesterase